MSLGRDIETDHVIGPWLIYELFLNEVLTTSLIIIIFIVEYK